MRDSVRDVTIGTTGYDETTIEPLSIAVGAVLCLAIVLLPRRRAIVPLLLVLAFVPMSQRVVIASIDFSVLRLVVMSGLARALARNEHTSMSWNAVDMAFAAWAVLGTIFHVLLELSFGALVFKLGQNLDVFGSYLLARFFLTGHRQIEYVLTFAVWPVTIVGLLMFVEWTTGTNYFHYLGSPAEVFVSSNDGRVRALGPFSHAIMAGCFHAAMIPFFVAMAIAGRASTLRSAIGLGAALLGVLAANSSGALVSMVGAIGVSAAWPFRQLAPLAWRGGLVGLLLLHIVMEKPVWHLLVRAAEFTGGGGYHRYHLIDACVRRFPEWAIRGTHSTAHWGWGLQDITNQWVLEAVRGGLLPLLAFNAVLVLSFRAIGLAGRDAERAQIPRPQRRALLCTGWALGGMLVAHCLAFLSVSYFGQMTSLFAVGIGLISSHHDACRQTRRSARPTERRAATIVAPEPRTERTSAEPPRRAASSADLLLRRSTRS